MIDVVTLTHNDDKELLLWQLYSIEQHLESCNFHIVINEDKIDTVLDYIKPTIDKIKNHSITVWGRKDILSIDINKHGWWHQQLIKLLMPLKDNYIVLDCKDIFIKETSIAELSLTNAINQPNVVGCKTWGDFFEKMHMFIKDKFENDIDPKKLKGIQTPRLIKQDVRNKILSFFNNDIDFINWFLEFDLPSEFILYDTVALHMNIDDGERYPLTFHGSTWNQEMWEEEGFDTVKENTHMFKIHRRVYNNPSNKITIDNWLSKRVNSI